jgi:hypothetical protein
MQNEQLGYESLHLKTLEEVSLHNLPSIHTSQKGREEEKQDADSTDALNFISEKSNDLSVTKYLRQITQNMMGLRWLSPGQGDRMCNIFISYLAITFHRIQDLTSKRFHPHQNRRYLHDFLYAKPGAKDI